MSVSDTLLPIDVSSDPGTEGVITLTLVQGDGGGRPVVVLDSDLLRAIDATLDVILRDHADTMTGLVLASGAPRSFVAGANLKEIMDLDDAGLFDYLRFGARVFNRLATMPVTTVAAINHAALGGGLELAMHCDVLIGAQPDPEKPYPVGLPEAGLGICPGWGGTNLLPARMDPKDAIVRTATGRPLKAGEAHEAGLLSELVEADALLDRARARSTTPKDAPRQTPITITDTPQTRRALDEARAELADKDPERAVLRCVERGLDHDWEDAIELEREELVRLRSTEQGRTAIEAFFARSAKK
ncbi:MAG: hypothetical protein Tsb0013_08600 [Phycisphaerales bacterium]